MLVIDYCTINYYKLSSLKHHTSKTIFIYLFMAVLGLHCCRGFSLGVRSKGYSQVVVCGILIATASFATEHGLEGSSC